MLIWADLVPETDADVQPDHQPADQTESAGRLIKAALAALLLVWGMVAGSSASFDPAAEAALAVLHGGKPAAGLAAGDTGPAMSATRAAAYSKPGRPHLFAGSASSPGKALAPAAFSSLLADGLGGGRAAPAGGRDHRHAAASGEATARVPTGPPARPSRAA